LSADNDGIQKFSDPTLAGFSSSFTYFSCYFRSNPGTPMREIYLIDRSDIDCFVTQKLLELWLDNVSVIGNLKTTEILHRAKTGALHKPIILMDIDVPLIAGVEFATRMATFNSNFSIYILSHFLNTHTAQQFCNCPLIKDYLVKPIDKMDVVKIATDNRLSLSKMIES
jgi:CheY-like chemotaxis protein